MTDLVPVLDIDRRHAADERRRELRLLGTAHWPNGDTGRPNEDIEADRIMAGADDTAERVQKFARFRVELTTRPAGDVEEVVRARIRSEIINTPETADFMAAVPLEAAHQRDRWGVSHDGGKTPFDWFWLIGYLAQKAATAQVAGDDEKARHHTISTAAALANWHAQMAGRTEIAALSRHQDQGHD